MELWVGSNMIHSRYILLFFIWHMYLYIIHCCHNYMYYVCET